MLPEFKKVNSDSYKAYIDGEVYRTLDYDDEQDVWIMHPYNGDNDVVYYESLAESQDAFLSSF